MDPVKISRTKIRALSTANSIKYILYYKYVCINFLCYKKHYTSILDLLHQTLSLPSYILCRQSTFI